MLLYPRGSYQYRIVAVLSRHLSRARTRRRMEEDSKEEKKIFSESGDDLPELYCREIFILDPGWGGDDGTSCFSPVPPLPLTEETIHP